MSRTAAIAALVLLVLAAGGAALYRFALPGLSSARPTPPVIEMEVATWLLVAQRAARSRRARQSPEA